MPDDDTTVCTLSYRRDTDAAPLSRVTPIRTSCMKRSPESRKPAPHTPEPEIMFRDFRQKPLSLIAILLIILMLVLVGSLPRALHSAK